MIIRRATDHDIPSWAAMLARLHDDLSAAEIENELRQFAQLEEPYIGFLAFDERGNAIGVIDARLRNYAEGAPNLRAAYVEDLWVETAHRRNGVGRALLAAVEKWARSEGLDWIGSDTTPDNQASRDWHRRMGFEEVEQLVVFGKRLD